MTDSYQQHLQGIDLSVPELAAVLEDDEIGIFLCIDAALNLLLNSKSTNPTVAALIATPEFKSGVASAIEFLDETVTLAGIADDLKLDPKIMSWAFLEARSRLIIAQRKAKAN